MTPLDRARARANLARFRREDPSGHYESFFLRANHPTRPLAFWLRYTLMCPKGAPERGLGELWAVWFDGEKGTNIAAKTEVPVGRTLFSQQELHVAIEGARLEAGSARGDAGTAHRISWDLRYHGHETPLFLLPLYMYEAPLPRAKSLVGLPMARFDGRIVVDGEEHAIDDWVGSQNHNWGTRHTDRYGWCQVCGFDDDPTAFLEVANARLRLGPLWSPWLSPFVVRHRGREIAINSLRQGAKARAEHHFFEMTFGTKSDELEVEGLVRATREDFVGLRYMNPPGGDKHCLNSKLATCELTLRYPDGETCHLSTRRRAAFEILTDDPSHGVPILF